MMTHMSRANAPLPIAVGFGISNAEQARQVAQHAEAIVVGSAIVNRIAEHGKSADLVELSLIHTRRCRPPYPCHPPGSPFPVYHNTYTS